MRSRGCQSILCIRLNIKCFVSALCLLGGGGGGGEGGGRGGEVGYVQPILCHTVIFSLGLCSYTQTQSSSSLFLHSLIRPHLRNPSLQLLILSLSFFFSFSLLLLLFHLPTCKEYLFYIFTLSHLCFFSYSFTYQPLSLLFLLYFSTKKQHLPC